jgi:hypothetical protein
MTTVLRQRVGARFQKIKQGAYEKRKPSGWVLPKQPSSFGDEGAWYFSSRL